MIQEYPVGTRYRISNSEMIVGRFPADMLEETTQGVYTSQVSPETYQAAMDLLTGGKVRVS